MGDDVTVNLRVVMERMGMTPRLLKYAFPGYVSEDPDTWATHMHKHPQWAHAGLLRMLILDPVLGLFLSCHDCKTPSHSFSTLSFVLFILLNSPTF